MKTIVTFVFSILFFCSFDFLEDNQSNKYGEQVLFVENEVLNCPNSLCSNEVIPGNTPEQACIVCNLTLLDGYVGSTINFTPTIVPPPFCGSIENNQFFPFIASQSEITFEITSSNCRYPSLLVQVFKQKFIKLLTVCLIGFPSQIVIVKVL